MVVETWFRCRGEVARLVSYTQLEEDLVESFRDVSPWKDVSTSSRQTQERSSLVSIGNRARRRATAPVLEETFSDFPVLYCFVGTFRVHSSGRIMRINSYLCRQCYSHQAKEFEDAVNGQQGLRGSFPIDVAEDRQSSGLFVRNVFVAIPKLSTRTRPQ